MDFQKKILKHYYMILEDNGVASFLNSRFQPGVFHLNNSTKNLWKIHDNHLDTVKLSEEIPDQALIDLKIELAKRMFSACCFCEHHCGIDRNKYKGNCGVMNPILSSEFLHIGEEEVLVPSHTIFFSGCTLHCVFCQNWDISQKISGMYIKPRNLVTIIKKRIELGSRNVNWVGGDPTPNLLYILQVLRELDDNIPQVWNSNMYCSIETMKLLHGIIDVYLTDFKFGNNHCAKRLAKIDSYIEIVQRNHNIAYHQGELIVRHLVLPNHIDCCSKPIIDWISEHIPEVLVNIMGQYRPEYQARKYDDISQIISQRQIDIVKEYAHEKGLFCI
jgi:putative pyruvate formate lyase activating enzyme